MSSGSQSVSAVVVNYNVVELLRDCLESLEAARRSGDLTEIIVIDSSSTDNSVSMIREDFPDVLTSVVPNRGYGTAVNAGFALAPGQAVFVLNPDTVICEGSVRLLRDALFSNDHIGLVGPRLVYPDGRLQPTRRRFPAAWTPLFESTIFEEWFPNNRWATRYRMADVPLSDDETKSVDWLVGAALMVRRETVEQAGGFDEAFWLYGEELEWCHRIRRHGWDIRYVPAATVVHHEGASTSQDRLTSRLQFDRGRILAQRALHGGGVARRTVWMVRLHYGLQLVREALKWSIGHRRDLRRERVANYWTLLKSDLHG